MAEKPPIDPAAAPVAPAPAVDPAPAPALVPDAAPALQPAPIEAPVVAPEAPAAPEIKRADAEPTLLELAGTKTDPEDPSKPAEAAPKPADAPKVDDPAKPAEPAAAEALPVEPAKPEPVKYEPFVLPEGARPDDPAFVEATTILSDLGVPQDKAQALVDKHIGAMNAYAQHLAQRQHDVFAETREAWRNEIRADAMLGGAGHKTAMAAVGRMRDLFVPKDERQAFDDFCRLTGAGDHPVFNRLLYRLSQRFDEPVGAPVPNNPAPDRGGNAKGGRRKVLYDHPTSNTNRAPNGAAR